MTKLGMRRTEPQKPRKRTTGLKAKKGLRKMSARVVEESRVWLQVKVDRMLKLRQKYGYIPCEICRKEITDSSELFIADAHHLNRNRRKNTLDECRILHRVCHSMVHDKNVREVPSLL